MSLVPAKGCVVSPSVTCWGGQGYVVSQKKVLL